MRTVLLLEFPKAAQAVTIFDMADMADLVEEFTPTGPVPEHLAVCPGYFDDRLAARLALGSEARRPLQWAHAGLPNLDSSDPNRPHTLLLLGYSAALKGEQKLAAKHWHRARTLDSSLPIPRSYVAEFVKAGGAADDAKAFSRR